MKYRALGRTGILVSPLCFGTLTMSPCQANLSLEEGSELLREAYEHGVNFWDTAEYYDNYAYLARAVEKIQQLPIIATKTYASTAIEAELSLEKARQELNIDFIPIFMLHEQESRLTLEGHRPALEYLADAAVRGTVQATGISCHTVAAVEAALEFPEIEIIHPIININGTGIKDGSLQNMLTAVKKAFENGLGIYAMKVLGGGHLIARAGEAISFVRELDYIHSLAIGIGSRDELSANLFYMQGVTPPQNVLNLLKGKSRTLFIEDWCSGCGLCIAGCPQGALALQKDKAGNARAVVENSLCLFCGYCSSWCPEFCIKVY